MTSDRRHLRLDQGNDTGHQVQFRMADEGVFRQHHLTLGEVVILNADSSIRPIIEFLSPSNVAIFIPNLSSVWFKTKPSFPNSLPDS